MCTCYWGCHCCPRRWRRTRPPLRPATMLAPRAAADYGLNPRCADERMTAIKQTNKVTIPHFRSFSFVELKKSKFGQLSSAGQVEAVRQARWRERGKGRGPVQNTSRRTSLRACLARAWLAMKGRIAAQPRIFKLAYLVS